MLMSSIPWRDFNVNFYATYFKLFSTSFIKIKELILSDGGDDDDDDDDDDGGDDVLCCYLT